MFCRHCGDNIPNDSVFCWTCGQSTTVNQSSTTITNTVTDSIPVALMAQPKPPNKGKKIAATLLIVWFSLMLLGVNAQASKVPKDADLAYLFGQLIGIALVITGFIFSVKWQIKLAGFARTSGRQAVAIFLIVFCSWGLFLVLMLGSMEIGSNGPMWMFAMPVTGAIIYAAGLYACIRWLKRLRRRDHVVYDSSEAALSKSVGT